MNMDFERKLTIPMEVKQMFPLGEKESLIVSKQHEATRNILAGEDSRIMLVIGPCSADNEESVLDYTMRLKNVSEEVKDRVFIIPRVYTNKPRTNGEGYKGLVHQPDPNEKPDVFKGIIATRELHMRTLEKTGFAAADEMLYPENHKYIDDLLGYVTVGARSVEDQQHRLTASGVDAPVGMKNPTSGDFKVMLNAIHTAQMPHTFIYRGWEAHSKGNPFAHAILRGFSDRHGSYIPNYHYEDVARLMDMYADYGLKNPAVIIDANHCNSGKNPFEQPRIITEIMNYRRYNSGISRFIKGFMVESYIEDGTQSIGEGIYGKSITDPCLGWEKTKKLIYDIAELAKG